MDLTAQRKADVANRIAKIREAFAAVKGPQKAAPKVVQSDAQSESFNDFENFVKWEPFNDFENFVKWEPFNDFENFVKWEGR